MLGLPSGRAAGSLTIYYVRSNGQDGSCRLGISVGLMFFLIFSMKVFRQPYSKSRLLSASSLPYLREVAFGLEVNSTALSRHG